MNIRYNFEYDKRLRAAVIGAGGHSYRNIYPTFQFAPVQLESVCDLDASRAAAYARQFGAATHHSDHHRMLAEVKPEVVFIVTNYTPDGRVQATDLAIDCMQAGAHVWMEKPTASTLAEIDQLIEVSRATGRHVMTGLKKVFFPAIQKVKEIISDPEFGGPSSVYIRYPQAMPPFEERTDKIRILGLLDHIYHPAAILGYLMGPIERIHYEWEPNTGGSVTSMRFTSGAVGTMHLAAGDSGSSPLERLEVVGRGANVVVENSVHVTYHRPAHRPPYGRAASYMVPTSEAALTWEPEFSLGQLYNKGLFLLGYGPEVVHFCESILAGGAPLLGTLSDSREIMKLYEAYLKTPPGVSANLDETSGAS